MPTASASPIPSYDLCPECYGRRHHRRDAGGVARTGASSAGRSSISGHSAGGHLAACMLATDWPAFDASLPEDLVIAAYAISGLFDLRPLVETSINKALRLDRCGGAGRRARCSGRRQRAAASTRWSAATKARNISGRAAASSRPGAAAGIATRFGTIPDANHFTAIAPLADPDSPMVLRLEATGGANSYQRDRGDGRHGSTRKRHHRRTAPATAARPGIFSVRSISRRP